MEHLATVAILVIYLAIKENWQRRSEQETQKLLKSALIHSQRVQARLLSLEKEVEDLKKIRSQLADIKAIATEAAVNSKTVVNEYEINGIPLGYKRGPSQEEHFDVLGGS